MTRMKTVSKEKYRVFEERAEQYGESMEEAYKKGKYEVCAGNAIQCAISAVDALSVLKLGRKSAGQNHNEVILLLKEIKTSNEEEKNRVCNDLYRLLESKTDVEYGDTKTSKATAEEARHLCRKIHLFVLNEIERATKQQ